MENKEELIMLVLFIILTVLAVLFIFLSITENNEKNIACRTKGFDSYSSSGAFFEKKEFCVRDGRAYPFIIECNQLNFKCEAYSSEKNN